MIIIKPVKQSKNCCGPASLKMVLSFYNIDVSENVLKKMTRTDQTGICTEKSLIEVAKKFGLKGYIKENSSLSELKTITDKNIPIIVDWNSPEEGGHYSVVVGFEDNNILLADPHFGEIKKHNTKWFEEKWVDSFEGREISKEIVVIHK